MKTQDAAFAGVAAGNKIHKSSNNQAITFSKRSTVMNAMQILKAGLRTFV